MLLTWISRQLKATYMENKSGLRPLGVAVLVKDYRPERKYGKIFVPENVSDRQSMIDSRVQVLAVGPAAWQDEYVIRGWWIFRWKQHTPRAKVGDVVLVSKFSGYMASGADKQLYRMVNDRDIFCGMDDKAFEAQAKQDLGIREAA